MLRNLALVYPKLRVVDYLVVLIMHQYLLERVVVLMQVFLIRYLQYYHPNIFHWGLKRINEYHNAHLIFLIQKAETVEAKKYQKQKYV